AELKNLIKLHQHYTGSTVAEHVLNDWDNIVTQFVKVMPQDYKRVLKEMARKKTAELAA
ncbi:MAG: hypothetical protein GXP14_17385, partial [Gammaproteobacteria bacterium]|nr:hypothetical protein [Gammaproteobacteria bacterium]